MSSVLSVVFISRMPKVEVTEEPKVPFPSALQSLEGGNSEAEVAFLLAVLLRASPSRARDLPRRHVRQHFRRRVACLRFGSRRGGEILRVGPTGQQLSDGRVAGRSHQPCVVSLSLAECRRGAASSSEGECEIGVEV